MKPINVEIKKVVTKVKEAQEQFQKMLKTQDWIDEARHYAERQGKEVKKLFAPDVEKLRAFLERERKELENFQKQIPTEVKKIRKFVNLQKKEFGKLLLNIRKITTETMGSKKKSSKKPKVRKSSSATTQKKNHSNSEVSSSASNT